MEKEFLGAKSLKMFQDVSKNKKKKECFRRPKKYRRSFRFPK